ncbi:MAG: DUF2306 domain-containing protein [Acidimicrobiales bacterium]|nr:DUF2306 domain-containing protein [Hyphomonadaceae bacterium]RZV41899.1 MAG: DUF2306 domain-containing protein [Acidimicrobiales bacterium]
MSIDVLLNASPAIQMHTAAAFTALGLGIAMFVRKKGTRSHKMIGRIFVVFMLLTAISALFIRQLNDGQFSWIHLFVPLSFYAIAELFFYIRKGNIKKHEKAVKGLFFGALLIPGFLSFLPGRTMWHVFFG